MSLSSLYRAGAQSPSTDYLPNPDLREGITLFSKGVRRGNPNSLYRGGIVSGYTIVGDTGAMRWLQSWVMDIVHIILLIGGGYLIFNTMMGG